MLSVLSDGCGITVVPRLCNCTPWKSCWNSSNCLTLTLTLQLLDHLPFCSSACNPNLQLPWAKRHKKKKNHNKLLDNIKGIQLVILVDYYGSSHSFIGSSPTPSPCKFRSPIMQWPHSGMLLKVPRGPPPTHVMIWCSWTCLSHFSTVEV
jgi:hypothetical protein